MVWLLSSVRLLRLHGREPAGLLCPWNSPGKYTGVGCHSLLQGIFLTQGSNLNLLHCRQILYHLSHPWPTIGVIERERCSGQWGHWEKPQQTAEGGLRSQQEQLQTFPNNGPTPHFLCKKTSPMEDLSLSHQFVAKSNLEL